MDDIRVCSGVPDSVTRGDSRPRNFPRIFSRQARKPSADRRTFARRGHSDHTRPTGQLSRASAIFTESLSSRRDWPSTRTFISRTSTHIS